MHLIIHAVALLALAPGPGQQPGCRDESGHSTHMIEVEPGVVLEVLEWSSEAPPLLLLAGLGNTGHVYDQFAQQFTGRSVHWP